MYICLCNGITQKHVEEHVNTGLTFKELKAKTGPCFKCVPELRKEYNKHKVIVPPHVNNLYKYKEV